MFRSATPALMQQKHGQRFEVCSLGLTTIPICVDNILRIVDKHRLKIHMMAAAVTGGIGATIIVLIMAKVQRATPVASPGEIRNHVDPRYLYFVLLDPSA